jgi:uncharacterized membrane protein YjjP (DUF1212 family)
MIFIGYSFVAIGYSFVAIGFLMMIFGLVLRYVPTPVAYSFVSQLNKMVEIGSRMTKVFFFKMIPMAVIGCLQENTKFLREFVHFHLTEYTFP